VVTYGSFEPEGAEPTGFTPKGPQVSAFVKPTPKSGLSSITVDIHAHNFEIEASRNLINDIVDAVEKLAAALGQASGAALPDALAKIVDSIQHLLHGKKLIYKINWQFDFVCSSDDGSQFEALHSLSYNGGVITPDTTAGTVGYKVTSTGRVAGIDFDLRHPKQKTDTDPHASATLASPDPGRDGKDQISPKPVRFTFRGGSYTAVETVIIELDVDGYGTAVDDALKKLGEIADHWIEVIKKFKENPSATPDFNQLLDILYGATKNGVRTAITAVKDALTKTTGMVQMPVSSYTIRCLPKEDKPNLKP
jgi:hypothetical protein